MPIVFAMHSVFPPEETLVLMDAYERAIRLIELHHLVDDDVERKVAKIILRIGRYYQKLEMPMNARDIAQGSMQLLMSVKQPADIVPDEHDIRSREELFAS